MQIAFAFSLVLLLAGVLVTGWCLYSAAGSAFSPIMKIGPTLISSAVITVPFKAFLDYRSKVAAYVFLLSCCSSPDPMIQQLIFEAMKDVVKKDRKSWLAKILTSNN